MIKSHKNAGRYPEKIKPTIRIFRIERSMDQHEYSTINIQ